LVNKDTDYLSNTNVSVVKNSVLVGDSLNVDKLLKIEAKLTDLSYYDAVSGTVKPIDIRTLHSIERNYFVPKSFSETKEFIIFKYPNRPTIYINKKDGLTYALANGYEERKQAWHLLRILGKFGYVENYTRTQRRKKKNKHVVGWTNL
jgi:hypothetical protein